MGAGVSAGLSFAVRAALSPIAIGVVVLVLASPRARRNGLAFLAGWMLGLLGLGTLVLLVATEATGAERGGRASWTVLLSLVLAGVLLAPAMRQWQSRPRPGTALGRPVWLDALDRLATTRALGGGVILAVVNPKNAALTIAAATAVAALILRAARAAG